MTENEEESKPRLFGVRDLQGTQQIPRRRESRLLPLNTWASQYPEGISVFYTRPGT